MTCGEDKDNWIWNLPFGFELGFERKLGFGGAHSCTRLLVLYRIACRDLGDCSCHLGLDCWRNHFIFAFDSFFKNLFADFTKDWLNCMQLL